MSAAVCARPVAKGLAARCMNIASGLFATVAQSKLRRFCPGRKQPFMTTSNPSEASIRSLDLLLFYHTRYAIHALPHLDAPRSVDEDRYR